MIKSWLIIGCSTQRIPQLFVDFEDLPSRLPNTSSNNPWISHSLSLFLPFSRFLISTTQYILWKLGRSSLSRESLLRGDGAVITTATDLTPQSIMLALCDFHFGECQISALPPSLTPDPFSPFMIPQFHIIHWILVVWSKYNAGERKKGLQILLSYSQAGSGREAKQGQEERSRNHMQEHSDW